MEENIKDLVLFGTTMVKLPSSFDCVAVVPPFTEMVTAGSGTPVCLLVTLPVMVLLCAKSSIVDRHNHESSNSLLIAAKFW